MILSFSALFVFLTVFLKDVEVGGKHGYACGSFSPPVGLCVCGRVSKTEGWRELASFSFSSLNIFNSVPNDFITDHSDRGGFYVGGVCVWERWPGEHLTFFSITL